MSKMYVTTIHIGTDDFRSSTDEMTRPPKSIAR